jgi:hypothetical protein
MSAPIPAQAVVSRCLLGVDVHLLKVLEIDEGALANRAEGFDLDHIPAEVLADGRRGRAG